MKPTFTLFVIMLLSIGLQAKHIPGHVEDEPRARRQFFGAQSAVNIQNNQFGSAGQNAQTRVRPVENAQVIGQRVTPVFVESNTGFTAGSVRKGQGFADNRDFVNHVSVVSGQTGHFNSRAGNKFRQNSMQVESQATIHHGLNQESTVLHSGSRVGAQVNGQSNHRFGQSGNFVGNQETTVLSAQSGANKATLVSSSNVAEKTFVDRGRVQNVGQVQSEAAVVSNKFNQVSSSINSGVVGSQVRNQQLVNRKTNVQGLESSQVEAEESLVGQRVNKVNQAASVVSESQVAGSQFVSGQRVHKNKQFVNSGFESNAQVHESGSQFVSGQSVVGGKQIHRNNLNKQHQQVIQETNMEAEQVTGQRFGKKNNFNNAVNSQSVTSDVRSHNVLVNNQGTSVVTGSIDNDDVFASKRVNQASSGKAVLVAGNIDKSRVNTELEASRFASNTNSKFNKQAEMESQVVDTQSKVVSGQKFAKNQFQSNFNQASKVVSGSNVVAGQEFVSGQRRNQVVSGSQVDSNIDSFDQSEQGSVISNQRFANKNNVNKATATVVNNESTVLSNRNSVVGSSVDQVQSEVVSGQKVLNRNQQFVNRKTNVQGSTGLESTQVEAEESVVGQRVNKVNQAASVVSGVQSGVVSESQVAGSQFVSGRKQLNNNRFNKHQQHVVEDLNEESDEQSEQGSAFSGQRFAYKNTVNKGVSQVNSGVESNAEIHESGSQFVSGQSVVGGKQIHRNKFNKQQTIDESNMESFGQSQQVTGQRFANKNTVNKASVAVVNSGIESAQPTADQVQEIGSQFFSRQNTAIKNKVNQQVVDSGVESFGQSQSVVGKNFIKNNQAASVQSNSNVVNSVVSEAQSGVVAGDRVFENKANLASASISTGSAQSVHSHGHAEETVMHASSKSGSIGHKFGAKKSGSQASFISEVSPTGFAKLDAGNFF